MNSWREILLEDVVDELTVGYVGSMHSEYVEDGVPFLRSLNVDPLRINKNDLKFISPEFHRRIKKSRLTPGDVVIVRTGKPGACAVVPDWLADANCSDLVIVRCGTQLNNRFLAYYVNTVASDHIAAHLVGAVQQHFNVGSARSLKMNLPPVVEQNAIANLLGNLDDKIDLLHRQNKTLEAMAETQFRQWFVEDAPEGWDERPLSGIANFLNGLACQKYPPANDLEKLPVLKIRELSSGISETADWATSHVKPGYIVEAGDVIFAWSASLMVKVWDGEKCVLNQHLFKVTSNQFPKWFYLRWCKHHLAEFIAVAASHATTMGHIKRGDLDTAMVLVPPPPVLETMSKQMQPLLDKQIAIARQRKTLEKLRDTLLPKLMSGEVRVAC